MHHFTDMPMTGNVPDPIPLIERGIAVFNLPPGGRVPKIKNWPNRWVRDPEYIRARWPKGANIGVACKPNGLLIIDLDRHHEESDGIESFRELLAKHCQEWPETFTVSTPRNGMHLYFWAPAGSGFGNTVGTRNAGLGPGIDTRGPGGELDGGYVVGPTSIYQGRTYDVVKNLPIAELPGWLADLIADLKAAPPVTARPIAVRGRHPKNVGEKRDYSAPVNVNAWVRAAVEGEVQKILDTPNGQGVAGEGRNMQLWRASNTLGGLVGAGVLDRGEAEQALTAAAVAVGLDSDENSNMRAIAATIRSGLDRGISSPRVINKPSTTRGTK